MADVTMPQLGETVTEGTITRWIKSVGEEVARDEPLFEVSTDKVDSEVPSPAAGVLSEILVPEGETVEVGARLAVIGDGAGAVPPSEAPAATAVPAPGGPAAPPAAEADGAAQAPPAAAPPQAAVQPPPAPAQPQAAAPVLPQPAAPPTAPGPSGGGVPPAPPEGYVARPAGGAPSAGAPPDGTAPGTAPAGAAPSATGPEALLLSPVVRRLLEEYGLSPSDVTGSGVGGRITREDVLREIDVRRGAGAAAGQAPPPAAPAVPAPAVPAPAAPAPAAPAPPPAPGPAGAPAFQVPPRQPVPPAQTAVVRYGDRVAPFSNMRRRTAEHMVRSKATSPHAFIAYEVDFENVDRVRRAWSERFKAEEGFSLTYLPFVARATVEALREYPQLNASVVEDSLVLHQQINLGVAVDLNHEGLIVPVVHRAEEITLRGIARRIRDVAERARSRQLTADDIAGGTFSVTNDGPFGTYFTVPIINQPQVAILATDGIRRRPVVLTATDGSESLAIHSVGLVGMSWDHRAVDGAYVSAFLRRLAEVLDTRDWAAEL